MIQASLDRPQTNNAVLFGSWLDVSGWAISDAPIREVSLSIDDGQTVRGHYGFPRPDVGAANPGAAHGRYAGFWASVPWPAGQRDTGTLKLHVADAVGKSQTYEMQVHASHRIPLASAARPDRCPWCGSSGSVGDTGQRREPFQLMRCGACGTGFVTPLPPETYLKHYYDNLYWQQRDTAFSRESEHYDSDHIGRLLRRLNPSAASVTEIGCGPGLLLNGLRKRGFQVRGQDFSVEASRVGAEQFGIEIRVGAVSQKAPVPSDCIVMRHSLEHSLDPRGDLEILRQALPPGGILLIVVPNFASLSARLLGPDWEWFVPPAHLFYFCLESFVAIAAQLGMELAHVSTRDGDGVPALEVANVLADYDGADTPAWRHTWMAEARSEHPLPDLGLGNELLVALRASR